MQNQSIKPPRGLRLAPTVTAAATIGVMAVGFTTLGGASATTPTQSGSYCQPTLTATSSSYLPPARAGVFLHHPKRTKTVTAWRTRTRTVTKTVTTTRYRTVYKCVTVTETTAVQPDSVLSE